MLAVAFDAMGVLYRSGDDLVELLIPFARANGSACTDQEIGTLYRSASRGEMTSTELWRRLGVAGDRARLDEKYLGRYALTPGILELLDELRGRGVPLGCITNDVAEWSRSLRVRFGLDQRIAHWAVSGEVGARKPDERIYRAFLDRSGLTPAEVVFVDDRVRNIEAAAALGFHTIHVDFPGPSRAHGSVRTVQELRAALADIGATAQRPGPASHHRVAAGTPSGLRRVLDLLPARPDKVTTLHGRAGPWLIAYGSRQAVLRWGDPRRPASLGHTPEVARAAVDWLHGFLSELTGTGFNAPRPVRDLEGSSIAVVDGAIWELLTHVPGRQMSWDADVREAGRALAYMHVASLALPLRSQRPGAMPFETCRPADPRAPVAEVQRELAEISAASPSRCVIHGDPTFNNIVIGRDGTWGLIDFTIALQASPLADIACGLWRTGRAGPDALTYDPARIAAFVAGYSSVRPLGADAARAIPVYLSARGLQLRERHERQGRSDETVIERLRAIRAQRQAIEEAIREALSEAIHGTAGADARRDDLSTSAARFCVKCGRKLMPPSDPQLKPHCPGCGWFQATSALPVALVLARSSSGRILYTRQRGWPENAWGLVAGYVESGETAEVAAVREVREETGLAARSPRVLRTLTWRDLVLIVVSVEVDDLEPVVGPELEAAMLTAPDPRLTPPDWPARAVVLDHIAAQR